MNQTYQNVKTFQTEDYEATITFDYFNERCRVDDYRGNIHYLIEDLLTYVDGKGFTKIIVKARKKDVPSLLSKLFSMEAIVDDYFQGDSMYFMCRYLSDQRRNSDRLLEQDKMISTIYGRPKKSHIPQQNPMVVIRKATIQDALKLSELYKQTFTLYPTPLHDSSYIVKTMQNDTIYYVAEDGNQIISAASSELNRTYYNAEITDCATDPAYRKHKLMNTIIQHLEKELKQNGIFCSYSIARAESFGMNAVLHQLSYEYRGRLVNNCYIGNSIENMNVWCKNLVNH